MKKLNKYITLTISNTFFPIFLTLFAITSVIYLVKIASLTSVITINFPELLFLYLLSVPQILFYTLPITYFVSIIINLSKLSHEYELIVITSFGLSPLKLTRFLIPLSLLLSITLFFVAFLLVPQADYLQKDFINTKKQEAQFNIKPSEYGQKFGPWYIYVQSKTKDIYKNITLYQTQNNKDTFIIAKKAKITTTKNALSLQLFQGSATTILNNMQLIQFNKMVINNDLPKIKKISSFNDILEYWQNTPDGSTQQRHLIQNIFISLMPIISILFYIVFGYFNPRYQKNNATMYAILLAVFYMLVMQKVATFKEYYMIIILPIFWIFLSYIFYRIKIKPYY
jgi:lipopolysaccharide export system permease protein